MDLDVLVLEKSVGDTLFSLPLGHDDDPTLESFDDDDDDDDVTFSAVAIGGTEAPPPSDVAFLRVAACSGSGSGSGSESSPSGGAWPADGPAADGLSSAPLKSLGVPPELVEVFTAGESSALFGVSPFFFFFSLSVVALVVTDSVPDVTAVVT